MRVWDVFPFFNEFEMLEIRLHELSPFVNKFILVESGETYMGAKKPLWFKERKREFKEFKNVLIPAVSPPAPNAKSPWDREAVQRNWILQVLRDNGATDDDLILLSDVDEIPRGQDFRLLDEIRKEKGRAILQFIQTPYFFYMNMKGPRSWVGTVLITLEDLIKKYDSSFHLLRLGRRHGWMVRDGGWHFTFMGGVEASLLKYKSYSHAPQVAKECLDAERLEKLINDGIIVVRDRHIRCEWVEIDDTYPKWFVENQKKFKYLIRDMKSGNSR